MWTCATGVQYTVGILSAQRHGMTERPDTDADLMLRFQQGDDRAFDQLVERHKQRVFNLVYRFLGARADTDDIAQEVFMAVYRARASYEPRARFTTWLFAIVRNTCYRELRRGGPRTLSLSQQAGQDGSPVAAFVADDRAPSALASLLKDERARAVQRAIDSLPEAQRMAVLLRRYEQFSYEEIAEAMGCSPKAVKSLLHRARANLKERLADFARK